MFLSKWWHNIHCPVSHFTNSAMFGISWCRLFRLQKNWLKMRIKYSVNKWKSRRPTALPLRRENVSKPLPPVALAMWRSIVAPRVVQTFTRDSVLARSLSPLEISRFKLSSNSHFTYDALPFFLVTFCQISSFLVMACAELRRLKLSVFINVFLNCFYSY